MSEPTVTEDIPRSVRDAQERFDAGMGANGAASPYPMLRELRARAEVHPGWPELGIFENTGDGPPIFAAYSFDAVKHVFTDNAAFSKRCYEAIVRPLQGPTMLEMDEPEHQVYRRLHEYAFARASMRWETELVTPLVESTIDRLGDAKRADLVAEVFMPIPVRIIAALLGLPGWRGARCYHLGKRSPVPRRAANRRCRDRMIVLSTESGAPIRWQCSVCDDEGTISNWEDSPFDLRRRRLTVAGAINEIVIPDEVAAALRELRLLDTEKRGKVSIRCPQADSLAGPEPLARPLGQGSDGGAFERTLFRPTAVTTPGTSASINPRRARRMRRKSDVLPR